MRKGLILSILFSILVFLVFLTIKPVHADTGPKPGMSFVFIQEFPGDPVTIISGELFECDQADCQDATPLMEVGPQHFSCEEVTCSALAYGFSTYHRIEINFSDGVTRRSNVFKTLSFNSSYKVTIRQDDLLVEPQGGISSLLDMIPGFALIPGGILVSCGICLVAVIIIFVLIILVLRRASNKK